MISNYEEKRNYIRMQAVSPALIELENGEKCQATCKDLSASGMLISTNTEVDIDSELTVSLVSHHGHSPSLHARCSIVRIEPDTKHSFLMGLKIEEILEMAESA